MSAERAIGLTGDAGSGKSSILAWLSARGAATLDGDAAVHALLAADPAVIEAVVGRFGDRVRLATGGIHRQALAGIVFGDPAALRDLEAIVHPAVVRSTQAWIAAQPGVAVVEAVKLIESGMHTRFDAVWLVMCDADVRRGRLGIRGWSGEEIERRLSAATPLLPKLALADAVVDNSGPWSATELQLRALAERSGILEGQRS